MHPLGLNADTSTARIAVDLVVLAVIAVQMFLGWQYGLLRRALMLLGVFPAVIAASHAGNAFAGLVRSHDIDANAAGFLAVFIVLTGGFELLGAMYSKQIRDLMIVVFDRFAGAGAGFLVGLLQIGVVVLVTLSAGDAGGARAASIADPMRSATLGSGVVALEPGVKAVLKPVLPDDLSGHLAANPG